MGILNVTPDSFSDGDKFLDVSVAVERAFTMVKEGADMIDIGGESSRPGALAVSVQEELRRVVPVIEAIRKKNDIPISVDTTKAFVAAEAIDAGANFVNDISAGRFDPEMIPLVAKSGLFFCLMHMQGTPQTMQQNPYYEDVVREVKTFLKDRIDICLKGGISKEKLVIDPGIGFGKRLEDNLTLLKSLDQFQDLGCPILIGTSRKSFIGGLTGAPIQERLPGSLASLAIAIQKGASMVRVHDVAATRQFLQIFTPLASTRYS